MSTRAYALFASSSKSQNWLPVVRISLWSALIYLLNFSRFALRAPMPVPKKIHVYVPGYLSCSFPFASDIQ